MNTSESKVLFESDWLASEPLFYDLQKNAVSHELGSLIGARDSWDFCYSGLKNYLDFGYSVFEQTPVQDIHFSRFSSQLILDQDNSLKIKYLEDPAEYISKFKISESDIFDLIRERVESWEKTLPADKEIVLPLSGGYDSRLLLWAVKDKSRIIAFTYGLSDNQERSKEVVYAKALAKKFNLAWQFVKLGNYHNYFDAWHDNFSVATHAHGMYHFEFYSKIKPLVSEGAALLSGVFGDAWAGSIPKMPITNEASLLDLGLTHGLKANSSFLLIKGYEDRIHQFWNANKEKLQTHEFQIIQIARFKLMLLSYLMRVPRIFGLQPWTPYLDIDIALAILNLPVKRRQSRIWQTEFFEKEKINLDTQNYNFFSSNTLNRQAVKIIPVEPFDEVKLKAIISNNYLKFINNNVRINLFRDICYRLNPIPKIGGLARMLYPVNNFSEAYGAYLAIKPLEQLITKNR